MRRPPGATPPRVGGGRVGGGASCGRAGRSLEPRATAAVHPPPPRPSLSRGALSPAVRRAEFGRRRRVRRRLAGSERNGRANPRAAATRPRRPPPPSAGEVRAWRLTCVAQEAGGGGGGGGGAHFACVLAANFAMGVDGTRSLCDDEMRSRGEIRGSGRIGKLV